MEIKEDILTYDLIKPIYINDIKIENIQYSLKNLKAKDRINAFLDNSSRGDYINVEEFEKQLNLDVFSRAANKINPNITLEDLLRLSIKDSNKIIKMVKEFHNEIDVANYNTSDEITLKLESDFPLLLINNEKIDELKFDLNLLTAGDELKLSKKLKSKGYMVLNEYADPYYLWVCAIESIKKLMRNIEYSDLLNLSYIDSIKITKIVRNFFMSDVDI